MNDKKKDIGSYLMTNQIKLYDTIINIGKVMEQATLIFKNKLDKFKKENKQNTQEYKKLVKDHLSSAEMFFVFTRIINEYYHMKEQLIFDETSNINKTNLKN